MLFEASTQPHLSTTSSSSQTPPHTNPHVEPVSSLHHGHRARWAESLRDLTKHSWISHTGSSLGLHTAATDREGFDEKGHISTDTENEGKQDMRTWRRERKKRRRKAEIYVSFLYLPAACHRLTVLQITRHISSLISRQTFILKLARAMMMFGGPTHRLQAQIQSTARVLEISLSCLYLPDVILIAFDDDITSTSSVKLIRQGSSLDLGKLQDAHKIYWRVCVHSGHEQKGN